MYKIFIDNDILNNGNKNPCVISNYTYSLFKLYIKLNKYFIVDNFKDADYIIINACNSDKNMTKDCSLKIFSYKNSKKIKGIISIGCWANNYVNIVDYVIKHWKEYEIDNIFCGVISFNSVKKIFDKKYKKYLKK